MLPDQNSLVSEINSVVLLMAGIDSCRDPDRIRCGTART